CQREWVGLLGQQLPVARVEQPRPRLMMARAQHLTEQDVAFLLSFEAGRADWCLLPLGGVADLPAVRWKLKNITRMSPEKHAEATERLRSVLNNLITEGLI